MNAIGAVSRRPSAPGGTDRAERPRSGIVGTGFIGGVHAAAVHAAGGRLVRVADSSRASAEVSAQRLRSEGASQDAESLVADPDVDVVHICTPNDTHARLARLALEHGKAVVCEKPLATTSADAEELADLAHSTGAVTAVPFVYRFHPLVREARSRLAAGDAGVVWLVHGSYLQDWLSRSEDTNWRADPTLGGASRAFGDIGVHWCDMVEFVTGHRIVRVAARLASAYPDRSTTEDGGVVLFETDQGATGSLVVSQVSPGRKNRLWFSVDGTDASLSFDQENPDVLWVGGREETRIVRRDPAVLGPDARRLARLPAGHVQGYQDAFSGFVADVYAAVLGERPDGLPGFLDGLRAARLTEAIIASSADRAWVEVDSGPAASSHDKEEA
jgi:predicted dehydrogenase